MTVRRHLSALARVAGRVVVWALLLLLLVRGTLDVAAGLVPTARELVRQPRPASPVREREASAFAAAFARAYLTFAPAHPEQHAAALKPYVSPWLGEHAGLELPPRGPAQRVAAAEPARVLRLDRSRLLVTVAAELAPARPAPVYLSMLVAGNAAGALAMADYPSFSPPPRHAAVREPDRSPLESSERAQVEDLLRRFFPVYLSGHADQLAYFLPARRTLDALGSRYRFLDLEAVDAAAPRRGDRLVVLARIRVRDEPTKATYVLRYRLRLEQRERWYVDAINTV